MPHVAIMLMLPDSLYDKGKSENRFEFFLNNTNLTFLALLNKIDIEGFLKGARIPSCLNVYHTMLRYDIEF